MYRVVKKLILIILLFFALQVVAQEPIWLSNQPPKTMEKEVKASGMHRYSSLQRSTRKAKVTSGSEKYKKSEKTNSKKAKNSYKRSSTKYVQWLRKGNSIKDATYICLPDSIDYQLKLISPTGQEEPISLEQNKACYVKFELNEEGYYNAYLILKNGTQDTLYVNIAKAELLSHSCRNGHHKKLEARPVQYYPEITEFEIIRLRHPHEDYHYFASSGDTETFKALMNGKPLPGVKITINTEKGWSKTGFTDKNGEFKIQFLQDYFSNWQELNKRKTHYYMLEADYIQPKDNQYKGKNYKYTHYILTMSDGYRPSRTMYASMVWGLIVFLTALIISIAGIFFYKERRKRPYKEIKFDESNN